MIGLSIVGVCTKKPCSSKAFFCPFTFFISALPLQSKPKEAVTHLLLLTSYLLPKMEPKYKVNPLTGELQEYVFEYNGILALRNFTARVEDERLILHAADDVNFSILEALVSEVEINGVVYDNPTAAQEALTRLTFNQNRPVLLDKSLKDLILGAVQKIPGKKLSTEDFTTELRQKLEGLQQVDTSSLLPKGGYTGTAQDLKNLIDNINRILQSDDTDLDQLQEIVTYIKQNKNILSTLGINNIAGLVEALAAKADKNHHHDDRYAPITHHHNEYAYRTHRHNKDDINGLPANIATTENIKTAVDGIQIGGRNYVLKSKPRIAKTFSKYGDVRWYNLSQTLELGKTYILTFKNYKTEPFFFLWNTGWEDSQEIYSGIPFTVTKVFKQLLVHTKQVPYECDFEMIKLERGNKPTDWTPAPEDELFKGEVNVNNLNDEVNRETGIYSINNPGVGTYMLLSFRGEGSTSQLEIFKPNWYHETRLQVRNRIDGNRYSGEFKDLAWYDDILRAGVECTQNTTLQKEHQNQTLFVTVPCNIELNAIDDLSSISFRKVFDSGVVSFSCTGKNIIYTSDNQFNGKKGSTAVISRYGNDCYIDIRNI